MEDRSTSTLENVLFALPLLEQRTLRPGSAIAVVKRHHRRSLVTLARHVPSLERIDAADDDGIPVPTRIDKELHAMRRLIEEAVDPLVADGHGWCRSAPG